MAAPDFIASNLYVETIAPPRVAHRAVSRQLLEIAIASVEIATDFIACTAGMIAAHVFTTVAPAISSPLYVVLDAAPSAAALGLIVLTLSLRDGAYRKSYGLLKIRETERSIRVSVQSLLLLLSLRLLLELNASWLQTLVAMFTVPALLILNKQLFSSLVTKLKRNSGCGERAVIYGAGDLGREILSTLLQSPRHSLEPVAVIDDSRSHSDRNILEMGYRGRRSIPLERRPLTASLLKAYRCDLLFIGISELSPDKYDAMTRAAHQAGAEVACLRDFGAQDQPVAETIDLDGIRFTSSREPAGLLLYRLGKRIADICASSLLIVLLSPLLILIAILVRLDSPGPSLFVQKRVGRNGEVFEMFKFRSMFTDAPRYARSPTTSGDPRITRVGRMLRRLSLDELPQLFNVLLGSMSLVGPRPEMPFIVEQYDARQRSRFLVKPGITGLWQLSADRASPIHQNIGYDLYYIRNRSFFMDTAILIHTLIFAICGGV